MLLRRIGGDGLPLVPGLVPVRMPRMAWLAPTLMRRVNGAVGAVRVASSSSTALSSIESALVERLALRMKEAEAVGEVPDRPSVVMESLRRCSFMAAVDKGPGKGATGTCEVELLRNRLVKAAEVTDPRRCGRAMSLDETLLVLLPLSEDIVTERRIGAGRGRIYKTERSVSKSGAGLERRDKDRLLGHNRGWGDKRAGGFSRKRSEAAPRMFIDWSGPRLGTLRRSTWWR